MSNVGSVTWKRLSGIAFHHALFALRDKKARGMQAAMRGFMFLAAHFLFKR
jgi:hypothetical protein